MSARRGLLRAAKFRREWANIPSLPGINEMNKAVSMNAYFQLQLGCELLPLKVNCFCFVPSASIVQICSLPDRVDW